MSTHVNSSTLRLKAPNTGRDGGNLTAYSSRSNDATNSGPELVRSLSSVPVTSRPSVKEDAKKFETLIVNSQRASQSELNLSVTEKGDRGEQNIKNCKTKPPFFKYHNAIYLFLILTARIPTRNFVLPVLHGIVKSKFLDNWSSIIPQLNFLRSKKYPFGKFSVDLPKTQKN